MYTIPCIYYRGGTSKGPCFLKEDLPQDPETRNKVLLNLMGSPSKRQINGIGGGNSLTSKALIINKSSRPGIDVDYLLCQVHVHEPIVETTLNCGNMSSAIAPFAIEKNLIKTNDPITTIRMFNENTGRIVEATVQTPNGQIQYEGDTKIDGASGTAAPIKLSFIRPVGSKTNQLLPTGNLIDIVNDVPVTCLDVAVPMVIIAASSLGKTGYETKAELDNDKTFMHNLESIRHAAAEKMGLGDVTNKINPKICIVSPPRFNNTINSRYFTPFDCHATHALTGGLCLAAACLLKGTVANKLAHINIPDDFSFEKEINIEHISGTLPVSVNAELTREGLTFPKASFIRTARPLFSGNVFVPGEKPQPILKNENNLLVQRSFFRSR